MIKLYKYKDSIGEYDKYSNEYRLNPYTKDLLENDKIYFSKPSELNDPYDSQLLIQKSNDIEEIKLIQNNPNFNHKTKEAYINGIISNRIKTDEIINKNRFFADIYRIFCLTPYYDNLLMWSHYCNSHRGICVGIKVHNIDNNLCIRVNKSHIITDDEFIQSWEGYLPILKMNYDKNDIPPKPICLFEYRHKKFQPFLLNKSKQWQYEEEYRVLLSDQIIDNQKISLYHSQICEIYFGLNTPDNIKKEVISILKTKENYNEIDIYSLRISHESYKLERVKINDQ